MLRRRATAALVLTVAALLAACAPPQAVTPSASPSAYPWKDPQVGSISPKPEIVLTDQRGATYDLAKQTAGKVTVLYFGYVNCPDACPATMATLTLAVRKLPADVRTKVAVVFVTTDPARDTPAALARWLSNFDPSFVGLTQTGVSDVNDGLITQAEVAARIPVATTESPDAKGAYGVDHAAYALVYAADGTAALGFFASSATADGEAADLTELVRHGWHQ